MDESQKEKLLIVYTGICMCLRIKMGFYGGSDGIESACNSEDIGSIPGLGRSPGEGNGYPLQYSCLENSYGQRNLSGCSPWGHRVGRD